MAPRTRRALFSVTLFLATCAVLGSVISEKVAAQSASDESALRAMGKRARATCQARFCTTRIIPLYEDFYRKVLAQAPQPPSVLQDSLR